MSGLAGWVANPWILATGAALVAVPIVIHLLNRRRFKLVDWAAMDFLLQADRKNRRRVQLENLLVLLLRCLAVLLLGLLLARPFDSSGMLASLTGTRRYEHIFVVDDSLSMQARIGNETAMDEAKRRMTDVLRNLSTAAGNQSLTVVRASKPEDRLMQAVHLGPETVDEIVAEIDRLQAVETRSSLAAALSDVDGELEAAPPTASRVVYVVTDLRRGDWGPAAIAAGASQDDEASTAAAPAAAALRRVAKRAEACWVLDAGAGEDRNLSIVAVRPEKTLVQGVESRVEVAVKNQGSSPVESVRVTFAAEGTPGVGRDIESLAPREQAVVEFPFAIDGAGTDDPDDARQAISMPVKIEVAARNGPTDDRLAADSVHFFAARLEPGIPVLLIDGDPQANASKSETYFLERAVAPPGKINSGVIADVVTEAELETVELDRYHVVFVCNIHRFANDAIVDRLTSWAEAGGTVVFLPGDHTDEAWFNDRFFGTGDAAGKGLAPARLVRVDGVESPETAGLDQWSGLRIDDEAHPLMSVFAGQQNPLLSKVKFFRWWRIEPAQGVEPAVAVPARLTDGEDSPFLADRPRGKGRSIVFAGPCDSDWSNWPSDPGFLLLFQDLVRFAVRTDAGAGQVAVGEPLRDTVDVSLYEPDAAVTTPAGGQVTAAAAIADGTNATRCPFDFAATDTSGFYRVSFTPRPGNDTSPRSALFAANVSPAEGDLTRADPAWLERSLRDVNVRVLSDGSSKVEAAGGRTEIWRYVLWAVVAALFGEQALAWLFGRSR